MKGTSPAADASATPPRRQVWGRRSGPRLRPGRRRLLDELLPRLAVTLDPPDAGGRGGRLAPAALFPFRPDAVWLEIGFGGGEHLAAQAAAHPRVGLIGAEPFIAGVGKLLDAVERQGLANVRVFADDARLLLAALPDASIARVFALFPDPWPKARHKKRRIVNPATAAELARVLAPGGELRLATDDADYARWMLAACSAEPRLIWRAERADDWRRPPAGWVPTRYERKAVEAGRKPIYLRFQRAAEPEPAGAAA